MQKYLLVSLIALAAGAGGDAVHFENGDRLTGTLVAAPPGRVAIDVAGIGIVTAPEAQVARVERTEDDTSKPRWDTTADVGVLVTAGNTQTQDATVVVAGKRSQARVDQLFGVSLARSEAVGPGGFLTGARTRTRDQLDVDYEARWRFGDDWYVLGNFEFFRDPIKEIDNRITLGAGAGRTLTRSEAGSLTTDIGVSQVRESLVGGDQSNPALRWGVTFNRWLQPERIELFHRNQLLKILDPARGAVWDSGSGVRFYLNATWQASLRMDLQHETRPAPARKKTDATYAVTVGVKL